MLTRSKMKLRSAAGVPEAPPIHEVSTLAESDPDAFPFLALPFDIRRRVYELLLVADDHEISIDSGLNDYYILNHASGQPTASLVPDPQMIHLAKPSKIVAERPPKFTAPATPNPFLHLVESSKSHTSLGEASCARVIPLSNVIEKGSLDSLPVRVFRSHENPSSSGWFIGPFRSTNTPYLPPSFYQPSPLFNAKILQTCKTVFAEAFPILCANNTFVLHEPGSSGGFLKRINGRSLAQITQLRVEARFDSALFDSAYPRIPLWDTLMRRCPNLRKLSLCTDSRFGRQVFRNLLRTVIRLAANIADIRKNTGEPKLRLRAKVGSSVLGLPGYFVSGDYYIRDMLAKKYHKKIPIPRKTVIEVVCETTPEVLRSLEGYERKGWRFERVTPSEAGAEEADTPLIGSWVELKWTKTA